MDCTTTTIMSNMEHSRKRQLSEISSSSEPSNKIRRIMSCLPPRLEEQESNKNTSPKEFLLERMTARGIKVEMKDTLSVKDFFEDPTDEEIDAYDRTALDAIRKEDIDELRRFQSMGRPLKCSNRFGESLLHLACRKGLLSVASFLVKEAGVTVRVRDDYGRTPLHDACWTHSPNFCLVELLLEECPELLFMSDRRGHSPLCYARQQQWPAWVRFLKEREQDLVPNISSVAIAVQ